MHKLKLRHLFLAFSLVLGAIETGMSCTCEPPPPPCYSYWHTDAVFIGRILKVDNNFPFPNVEVVVEENFKGMKFPVAKTTNSHTSCSFTFSSGERFLFYASADEKGANDFGTGFCTGTTNLNTEPADLEFLRSVKRGESNYWIWATVYSDFGSQSAAGIRAEVLDSNPRLTGISDANGNIKIVVPGTGKYKVRIWLPKEKQWSGTLRYSKSEREAQIKLFRGGGKTRNGRFMTFEVDVSANRCGWIDLPLMNQIDP